MDQKKLENNLNFSKLILGEIESIIKTFIKDEATFPIGFVGFDLDYYS